MKKLILLAMLMIGILSPIFAQNDTVIYIADQPTNVIVCPNQYDRAIVYGLGNNCTEHTWEYCGNYSTDDHIVINATPGWFCIIYYYGCEGFQWGVGISFPDQYLQLPNPTTQTIWKHQSLPLELQPVGNDSIDEYGYEYLWSTGETEPIIEINEPDTYICEISDVKHCATVTRTFIVRDNVELYRATCDLRSNLNKVTWLTTPEQAEYIREVKIYRNTYQLVATVPYTDGSFTDDIGSDATQWQYHIVGVDTDGNDCPLPSYWKRTIHLDHVQGTQGEILQWTPYEEENPSKDVVIAYAIYDVVNGEPQHVIDVGNFTNVFAYDPANFDGYGTVAAVFEGKGRDMEDLAFSNLTSEVLDIDEIEGKVRKYDIYPNPTNGPVTIKSNEQNSENEFTVTISNLMGQTVATGKTEGGVFTTERLTPGIYFVNFDGNVQKLVVE